MRQLSTWTLAAMLAISSGGALAAGRHGPVVASSTVVGTSPVANPLLEGAELLEQLTETAPQVDERSFATSMKGLERLRARIVVGLTPAQTRTLDDHLAALRTSFAAKDRAQVALHSVEGYRLLQEAVKSRGPSNPLEVSLLDYAGFKLGALLSASSPDWAQAAATSADAARWWRAIEPRVKDKALSEAMSHVVAGFSEAVGHKDARLLRFAAEQDLILVDGLEGFFAPQR